MEYRRIILNGISSGLGYQGREARIYEHIISGYESAQKLRYTPGEYLKGCRQANINLFNEFLKVWADHYQLIPNTPGYKEFYWNMRNISPYGEWSGFLRLDDFRIIRIGINKAEGKLLPLPGKIEAIQHEGIGKIKDRSLSLNSRYFVDTIAEDFFIKLRNDLVIGQGLYDYSFIFWKMLKDGFIYENVKPGEFLNWLKSDQENYKIQESIQLVTYARSKTKERERRYKLTLEDFMLKP